MLRHLEHLRRLAVAASDGEVGKLRDVYFDDQSWIVRYLVVATGSWLSGRDVLIPPHALGEIDEESGIIHANLTTEQIRHSPAMEGDSPISRDYEEIYHRHYGWNPYWTTVSAVPGMVEPPLELSPVGTPANVPAEDTARVPTHTHLRSCRQICGYALHAKYGTVGHVEDFIVDDSDWHIRYLIVGMGMLFAGRKVLLAPDWIEAISFEKSEVGVDLPRDCIKEAPEYNPSNPIDREFEQRMHDYYTRYASAGANPHLR